jgi:hypothetical protein
MIQFNGTKSHDAKRKGNQIGYHPMFGGDIQTQNRHGQEQGEHIRNTEWEVYQNHVFIPKGELK